MGQADAKGLLGERNLCAVQPALKETSPQQSLQGSKVHQYRLEMLCYPAWKVLAHKGLGSKVLQPPAVARAHHFSTYSLVSLSWCNLKTAQ